jgi:peptidyl-dipeptidase Dcp
MRMTLLASTVSAVLLLTACSEPAFISKPSQSETTSMNALLTASPLLFKAPPFDQISSADYEPAFDLGMRQELAEINTIATNPEMATFTNTVLPMEKSGELLERTSKIFFALSELMSDAELQRIEADIAPKLAAHSDAIYLNTMLFERVAAIYKNKASLDPEDQKLVDDYYRAFVRAGAQLNEQQKQQIRDINTQLSSLETAFSQNLLAATQQDFILVSDKQALAGLKESDINTLAAAAQQAGQSGYLISIVNTTRQPILSSLQNRALREKIWRQSANRAIDTNGPVLLQLVKLRAQKANLLGYANWASFATEEQMAKTPAAVLHMLDELAPQALAKTKLEAADIQAQMRVDGINDDLQPWDWAYYAEKVRLAKYKLDDEQVKPYFELNAVLKDGLFFAMQKLYGLRFKERHDLPVYHPDVRVFDVINQDDSALGLFYLDAYAREGKAGGAWMDELVSQNFLRSEKPVVFNALNIVKPADGQPTLLSFDETTTLFHEFGHAAHGLFSQVKYPTLAGTATASDFVEFPSQFNEDWAIEPSVIANYAKHYQTGEAMPGKLLDKVLVAVKFNQGYDTTEYLAAALLDMEWHMLASTDKVTDVAAFEQQALAKHGLDYRPVPPRYKSAYFSHSFGGGYSAAYYAYLWSEVLAADAFAFMQQHGGLTLKNGETFRQQVLSKGNTEDLMQSYADFRGRPPSIDALLKRRGLVP